MGFRYALRSLRRTPAFTGAAVLSLTLGIGANAAIFSVVNSVLLRPLEYANPERLVFVALGGRAVSPAMFLEWRARNRSFERMGAAEYWTPNFAARDRTEQVNALHLSSDVLPLLGVEPIVGRMFTGQEEHGGHDRVVVLGHALWKTRFGSDPNAVGQSMTLDGEPYTIVGVMPETFRFAPFWATKAQLWAPLSLDGRQADNGGSLRVFARLGRDVTLDRARAEMTALTAAVERERGRSEEPLMVTPLHEMVVGDVKPALLILLGATALVLLIACANVAHLQLVRGAGRERELAVCTALGASRVRVVQQLLTESALLCCGGIAAGLAVAYAGVRVIVAMAPPELPRIASISIDARVLIFMLVMGACAGLIFGVAPAVRAARVDVNESLKTGGRGSTDGDARNRLRGILVVSEFAMAIVLLASAVLILKSFLGLLAIDAGFDPRNVIAMEVSVAGTKQAPPSRRAGFYRELAASARATPGVHSASAINHLPLVGDYWRFNFIVEGRPPMRPEDRPSATYRVVLPGYFETMRIQMLKGRDVTERDVRGAPCVVVINEFMARREWPGRDAVGKRLATGNVDRPDWCTVVGVVRNVKQTAWSEPQRAEMYFSYVQTVLYLENLRSFGMYMTLVARTSTDAAAAIAAIDRTVRTIEPAVVVSNATTMERAIGTQLVAPRFYMVLLGMFAAVAVVLAAIGIYGVISHSVARRTHEIGVRMALGAGGRAIVNLVITIGLRLAAVGSVLGCVGALLSTRYLRTLLVGVDPLDPATFVLVPLALMMVAVVACWLPGRRASRVDPMVALRTD
jgi:predicted permease